MKIQKAKKRIRRKKQVEAEIRIEIEKRIKIIEKGGVEINIKIRKKIKTTRETKVTEIEEIVGIGQTETGKIKSMIDMMITRIKVEINIVEAIVIGTDIQGDKEYYIIRYLTK